MLIQTFEESLPEPGKIDLTRLNFPTKLELALALKLLPHDQKGGFAALNAARKQRIVTR
jgi:hypothetical protein